MKIAAAQIAVSLGNIEDNIEKHINVIQLAIANDVDFICFPEMSLTGYCREEAASLALTVNSHELQQFQELADTHDLTISIGAPIHHNNELYIGAFILSPNQPLSIYTKQHLHGEEANYFKGSNCYNPVIAIKTERIQLAICADINQESHVQNAKYNNATLYAPGIFFSEASMTSAHELLANYAQNHCLAILMANFTKNQWNMTAGGQSAFWNDKGDCLQQLNNHEEGILIIKKQKTQWEAMGFYS